MTTSALEERMARIEGAFEQIDRRLTTLEQDMRGGFQQVNGQIDHLTGQLDHISGRIDHLTGRIDRLMYWQLGLLGAIAASTVAIVLTR